MILFLLQEFESDSFQDKYFCLTKDGHKIDSEERILVISPEDYYFFHFAKLEDVTGKFIPKETDKDFKSTNRFRIKSFSNPIIVNGMLDDKNGGKLEIRCSFINNEFGKGY